MTETLMSSLGIVGVLLLTFIPVNMKIGDELWRVMLLYVMGFAFRALFILGAFFNGARIEVLIGIMITVALEVTALARIGMEDARKEAIA